MDETNNLLPAPEPQPRRTNSRSRILLLALVGIVLLVAVGVAAYTVMNTPASVGTGTPPDQAAQQFFTERNNGTPVVISNTMSYGGPGTSGKMPGVVGTIEKVDGTTFTVKNPMDGTTTTVQAGPQTVVRKQADVKLSDLAPGTTLHVIGQKKDGVMIADLVQVGDAAPAAGGPLLGGPLQIQVAPGGDGGTTATMPEQVIGTLDKVDGTTLTLKTADGSATVQVSPTTAINQQVTADVAALAVGDNVVVQGTQTGAVFAATTIDISPGGPVMIRKP